MKTTLEANGLFLNHIPAFIPIKMFAVDDNIVNSFKFNQSYPLQLSSLHSHNSVYLCSALLAVKLQERVELQSPEMQAAVQFCNEL